MASGILIVDKPAGWTSQDVVSKLRGVFHERRVGHGGTLDPMATGVLPVFFGRATRAVEFFEHAEKTYRATLRLGMTTDTQDTTGTVLQTAPVTVGRAELEQVLLRFTGEVEQLPPMYSAIKINGKKLYEIARKGGEVERKPRKITVFKLKLERFDGDTADLLVHCSKGTYVRTLCHDLGAALGCGGCMAALRRVQAGAFSLEQAVTLEQILSAPDPAALLLPTDTLFATLPAKTLSTAQARKCRNGAEFRANWPDGRCRLYDADGEFLALASCERGIVRTVKSFFAV